MRKINKRKVAILIFIICVIIFEIIAFSDSMAKKTIEINASLIDVNSEVETEICKINATDGGKSGYYVILPELLNEKQIKEYLIENKEIISSKEKSEEKLKQNNQENIQVIEETNVLQEKQINENNDTTKKSNIENKISKKPKEKIFLTEEEVKNKAINLKVVYDTKKVESNILYKKQIEKSIEQNVIKITGYMPKDATIEVKNVNNKKTKELANKYNKDKNKKVTVSVAYDIKILSKGKEYEPTDFDEEVKVAIEGIEDISKDNQNNKKYKVVHIDENKIEEIEENRVITNEDTIYFHTNHFSTYAVLLEEDALTAYNADASVLAAGADNWDGTTASGFEFGQGTQNAPYLITTGAELSYIASQVNSGSNTYENVYFQLTNDIDLNGNVWTPIGDTNNSFRGIFDGAGHIISNTNIAISSLPTSTIESYGIFGSIGGGNNKAIVKNIEIDSINIKITASGTTDNNTTIKGYHIGVLAGTLYKNAQINNVIIKNSQITDTGNITIRNNSYQLAVGGIAGYATNTPSSTQDPGNNNRYSIENCFVNVIIDLNTDIQTSWWGTTTNDAQYHTGGIIGTIRSQPVWPSNCLYVGTISSNGFIGPIFAALINNTSYTNRNNYATLWNGNDAGNLTMDSYYSGYSASGTTFTTDITTGNSTSRRSNSTNNIGYVQGNNKGRYTNDISSRLNSFNEYATNNGYLRWKYENGTYTFSSRFMATMNDENKPNYVIEIQNEYSNGPYTYKWYINGQEDVTLENKNTITKEISLTEDYNLRVLISDGQYYSILLYTIPKMSIEIEFDIDNTNNSVTAKLTGKALPYVNLSDYTYQWYKYDLSGEEEKIENGNSLTLKNLERGMEYKLVATNNVMPHFSAENSFIYGNRTVIYVDYNNGNNNNDGFTDTTPVKNLSTAYSKLEDNGNRNTNVIVIMGNYTDTSFLSSQTATTYSKKATITGKYKKEYNGVLTFHYERSWSWSGYIYTYKYMTADTTFQYLTFDGDGSESYFYLQGHSLTIGEGVRMTNYGRASSQQGLNGNNAPAFHIFAGWLQYDYAELPTNNAEVLIKSGTYGRIILGGSSGTSDADNFLKYTSHNFTGSSMEDSFKVDATIDIKNSTTPSEYDYDVNLLTGGSASGNNYSRVTINVKSGTVGRLLGASIGDSSTRPNNWDYPLNTFLGETTINIDGGKIAELYGGCLGRNMWAIGTTTNSSIVCDSYFYGIININIFAGEIIGNIYGAGAGGVTGYSPNSTDKYKSYGESFETSVNINVYGGTINGNIYGGGYGYTEYLTDDVTAVDGGSLYGDSNIKISGSPVLKGNIYAGGRGYDLAPNKTNLAQMEGDSYIEITGTPTIEGKIFGAGDGISAYEEMAKLTGNSTVKIDGDLSAEVYGGGNISKTLGTTNILIQSGNHMADIYGGGNIGAIEGTTNVTINGGIQARVFGGGNQAQVSNSVVTINGGETQEVYAGGNQASVNTTKLDLKGGNVKSLYGGSNTNGTIIKSNILINDGRAENVYGGNNLGGNTEETLLEIKGGNVTNVYGGGNQAQTGTSTINIDVGTVTNIYGGGNEAGITTSNINLKGGTIEYVYGGSNKRGDVETTNIKTLNGEENTELNITYIYGGNNQGGLTKTSNITIEKGNVTDVYGGGNLAVTDETNVQINGEIIRNVYGGGNQAGITNNTNIKLVNATIGDNVYGGGNEGTVGKDTYVDVKNSILKNNLYAGGNGSTAVVYGNTNLVMQGNLNKITNNVFGGGNKAATGTQENNNSISKVNITGGSVGKNVYGGANTSVVYGVTQTKIGYDAVNDTLLERGDIKIDGTIFGGGEANESGSEIYDYSFISVTDGIEIKIDGNGHDEFYIKGSIFGSGNASSTSGESYIDIKNYGQALEPQSNISIQRANLLTVDNSAITLDGATDRTNEYSSTYFTISRVDEVKLKNNSTLYLKCGANLLKKLSSVADENGTEVKGSVTIDKETGETIKNVDNRIYMLEGKNLNIATNEQVTAYGEVYGMMFLGLFTNKMNPSTSTGLYNPNYNNNDEILNAGTFSLNSYVLGRHHDEHNIEVDGFYTNENNNGRIKTRYVEVTPEDDVYYIWLVGEKMDVKSFDISLVGSKYATLGTHELSLTGFSKQNIKFVLSGFSSGLQNGISLVEPSEIDTIAENEQIANNVYGLTMRSGNNGWQSKNSTTFLTQNGGDYTGSNIYLADNSTATPTLNFCFYHSANISEQKQLGDIRIRFQVMTPIDDLNYDISYIDINIALSTALYQDDYYEAAITPGEEFGLFTTTETNITNDSTFSTYYSLYISEFSESKYFNDYKTYKRVLVSRDSSNKPYVFPVNTKLTLLDMVTNKYYYYVVSQEDFDSKKFEFYIKDFMAMDSTNEKFDETNSASAYYDAQGDLIYENFIFHIDFGESNITSNIQNNTLLMELQDQEDEILIGVLGIQRDIMKYSVYADKEAIINLEAQVEPTTVYLKNGCNLTVTTDFVQDIINSKTIYDTKYFNDKMGIKITMYDNNGNRINGDTLLGTKFILKEKAYYPMIDGSVRICIADKVSNVLSNIKIDTTNNTNLATGDYVIKIESFGSPDGIYYGLESSDMVEINIKIINSSYGLKVHTDDNSKIIDQKTGNTLNGNNALIANLEYSSGLMNPRITVSLYRRDYSQIYAKEYEIVDLSEYVLNDLTATKKEKEYLFSDNPTQSGMNFLRMKENLTTGTYRLVYKLYDDDTFIGEAYEYIIIK